ncbi:MAG: histidine phosphatase family protein [Bradyrhizobiaceae bacterium]|nr:MAG: histidine phosphatase family protein [Bradyrhizobiaceae bacterium]
MRRLILLRHAKTERDSASGKDRDRCLDERGESDAVQIGAWLAANGYLPDVALVSTATRARQTWDRISPYMPHCRVKFLDDLYLPEASQLFKIVQAAKGDPETLLVVGHNPGMHELAWNLTGKSNAADRHALGENLPTAAAVVIDFAVPAWSEIAARTGTLKLFISPKRLREASGAD